MRNLKRALSLALAAIMLVGMMVIGASAVDYSDFTDSGDIVNRDAVTMLTTLGVIDGKPDGSYAPTELVTRDQMAKMISVILNQGADVNDVYANLDSGLTDISSNWAKGHINYCYTLGVIAGRGDGTFDPGANVTAAEAAKMLLVAAGYDPATEGFVGAQWSWNVNAKASSLGIYKNYTKGVLEPLNRDDAALLIYNALDIERIERYENGYARVYADNRTILSSLYGVYKVVGVVIGNEWAQLEQTGVDDALAAGKTRVAQMQVLASDTQQTNIWANGIPNVYQFNVSTPEEYLGKAVTMFIRKETILNSIEVLGVVYNAELNNVVTVDANKTAMSDVTKNAGISVRDADTEYYVNYGHQASAAAAQATLGISRANSNGIVMEAIDNDDDGVVEYVLYKKEDLAVVSSLSKDGTSVTMRGVNKGSSIDIEDMVTDLTFELDDVVLVITYGGRYYITEPQIVTGEMDSYTAKKDTEQSIDVDGVTYKPSFIGQLNANVTSANGIGDIIDFDVLKCEDPTGVDFEITYDFFLDSHGYIRAFRPTEQSLPNYALIINSGYDPGEYSSEASGKVTVLLRDGSEATYPINFSTSASNLAKQLYAEDQRAITVNGSYNVSKTERGIIELKGFLGTNYTDTSATRPWRFQKNDDNADKFQFAYKDTSDENNTTDLPVNTTDYKAGHAAGYVIQYTLSESGVMTIKNVIGSVDGYSVNKGHTTNNDLRNDQVKTLSTMQGNVKPVGYSTGDAKVYYAAGRAIAVDKNTVAFYYDVVKAADLEANGKYANRANELRVDDVLYGVAVGYENMASVRLDTKFMASNVVRTTYNASADVYEYECINLADVILFNEANIVTARDYAFVLGSNRRDVNNVTLNVLFEDGTAGTLTVTRSNFENVIGGKDGFDKPYAYTIDANDKATIYEGSPIGEGHIWRLQVGTVAMDNTQSYWPYNINEVNIWDVTEAEEGEDGVKMLDFPRDNSITYRGYMIQATDGSIRTAFLWEGDADTVSPGHSHDWESWALSRDVENVYNDNDVQRVLNDGKDVEYYGDLTLGGNLYIPEGRILRVRDDFDSNGKRVYGPGKLWVMGDSKVSSDAAIEVNTRMDGDLSITTGKTATLNGVILVKGDITTNNGTVIVEDKGDVHVLGDYVSINASKEPKGTLTVKNANGHMEINGNAIVETVNVYSNNTLIVGKMLTAKDLNIGDDDGHSYAGRVQVGSANVTNIKMVVSGSSLTQTDAIGAIAVTDLKAAADTTLTAKAVVVDKNGTATLEGKISIGTLNIEGAEVSIAATASGTISKVANLAVTNANAGKMENLSSKVVINDKTSGVVVKTEEVTRTENGTEVTVQVGTLVGTNEGAVAIPAGTDEKPVEVTVKKDTTASTGDLTVGNKSKVIVAQGAVLNLTGGAEAAEDATDASIEVTGTVNVQNGNSAKPVNVDLLTIPENVEADAEGNPTIPATISFASNAKLTAGEDFTTNSKFYDANGDQITDTASLRGLTFKLMDKSKLGEIQSRDVNITWIWISITIVIAPNEDAELTSAMLSAKASDYVNGDDALVIDLPEGSRTITIRNVNVKSDNTNITLTVTATGLTVGCTDSNVTVGSNGTFTFNAKTMQGKSFTLTASGTGLNPNVYTVKFETAATSGTNP